MELLDANYTFLNQRLAEHYGIPNIYGAQFRKVTLTDPNRGGLLGQGSMLTVTSYPNRTSVVQRGKWILDNLLGSPPPPPPPVPDLKPHAPDGRLLTMREAMEQHRSNAICQSCHARMDPIGFALENYDGVGKWRDKDGGNPIDASGKLPGGVEFEGAAGAEEDPGVELSRPVRGHGHRKVSDLRAGPRPGVLRQAGRSFHHAPGSARQLPNLGADYRHREEHPVSDEEDSGTMIITKKSLPRRTFLRGLGTTLALPLLDSMIPALSVASASKAPVRLGFVFHPVGMILDKWMPTDRGHGLRVHADHEGAGTVPRAPHRASPAWRR